VGLTKSEEETAGIEKKIKKNCGGSKFFILHFSLFTFFCIFALGIIKFIIL